MMNPGPPPPLPAAPTESTLSLGVILLRALLPPLLVGVVGALLTLAKGDTMNNVAGAVVLALCFAALANVVHLSAVIVSRPEEPPLGLPRAFSGVMLFVALAVLQVVIAFTAFFGGCACMASMGANVGGLH